MHFKYNRILSLFLAISLVVVLCVGRPKTAKADPLTASIIWALGGICGSFGLDMALSDTQKDRVTEAFKALPQAAMEKLTQIEAAYLTAAGIAAYTWSGQQFVDVKAEDLSLAASMLKNQLPMVLEKANDQTRFLTSYDSVHSFSFRKYYSSYNLTASGQMYEYDHMYMNKENDRTQNGIIDTAIFVFEPTTYESNTSSYSYPTVMCCVSGSAAHHYMQGVTNVEVTPEETQSNMPDFIELDGALFMFSGGKQPYKDGVNISSAYFTNSQSYGVQLSTFPITTYAWNADNYRDFHLSSALGLDVPTTEIEADTLKSVYGELSKILDQLIKDHPELANDVISVPVPDDSIGNDLPSLIATLKALEKNQAEGTQDLITAIERALAKADVEAIATAGALTGIAEGVTSMTGDLADVKEKVGELTDAMTEEVELDMDRMRITANLATRFPFCIPFDLANAFSSLGGLPRTAPSWTLPWTVEGTTAEIELDLSEFEEWAKVIRWGTLITFNIGLILVTRKLIKG